MKTELHLNPHALLRGVSVIEVWYDGQFIATVAGADGPGVRVYTKHPMIICVLDVPGAQMETNAAPPGDATTLLVAIKSP